MGQAVDAFQNVTTHPRLEIEDAGEREQNHHDQPGEEARSDEEVHERPDFGHRLLLWSI